MFKKEYASFVISFLRALCCVGCVLLTTTLQAQTLRIGSWDRQTDAMTLSSEAILSRAYAELGQSVEFVERPVKRAMHEMLGGTLDGNIFRIAGLAKDQPQLFRVETPITATEVRVYTVGPALNPTNWKELKGMRVAYHRGTLLLEQHLPADCQPVPANGGHEIYKMLAAGMADVAISAEAAGIAPHPNAVSLGLRRTTSALESTPLHHYLLKSHSEIGMRLDVVLKRMQASGEMEAIRRKAMETFK